MTQTRIGDGLLIPTHLAGEFTDRHPISGDHMVPTLAEAITRAEVSAEKVVAEAEIVPPARQFGMGGDGRGVSFGRVVLVG